MNMTKPKSLLEKMKEQEEKEQDNVGQSEPKKSEIEKPKKSTVGRIITDSNSKSKQISAKVNETVYEAFSKINKLQGVSNNSALNMIIAKYVRENKDILEDE